MTLEYEISGPGRLLLGHPASRGRNPSNEIPGPHDDLKVEVSQYVSYFQCWLGSPNRDSNEIIIKKTCGFLDKENIHSSLKRLTFLDCRGSPALKTKKGLVLGCVLAQLCPTRL